jgi:hypothetical protein
MATHRFKLVSLQCISPRSKAPYADWLMVSLVAVRNGQVIGSVASLLGDGPGKRIHFPFKAGATHDFAPTFFGTGTDLLWEVAFDVAPGLPDVDLRVVIANVRDVDDPYVLARLSIAIAAIGISTAAGVFLGEKFKETLAKIASDPALREAAEKILGEAWDLFTDRLPGWLFDEDWPDCAGDVLVWARTVSGSDVDDPAMGPIQIATAPETAANSGTGCGRPSYLLTAALVDDAPFGRARTPLRTRYVPCRETAASSWEGIWQQRSAEVRVGIGAPRNRHYDVAPHEAFATATDAKFPGIRETVESWPLFVRDVKPTARPTPGTVVSDEAYSRAAAAIPVSDSASQGLGGLRGGRSGDVGGRVTVAAPEPPPAATGLAVDNDLVGRADLTLDALEHGVRTLSLPSGARLGLYTCIQEFADGSPIETGPFVRYVRDATVTSTQCDVMLPRYLHIG